MTHAHVLFTGQNRNPGLFLQTLCGLRRAAALDAASAAGLKLRWVTADDVSPQVGRALKELDVEVDVVTPAKRGAPTWQAQGLQLFEALRGIPDDAVVLKTRPDVVLAPDASSSILAAAAVQPSKIWVPFVHATYPGIIGEHTFAGRAGALRRLLPVREEWRSLYGPPYYEAHIRRFTWLWDGDEKVLEMIESAYDGPSGSRYLDSQSGLLGPMAFKALHGARLKDSGLRAVLADGLHAYWRRVRDALMTEQNLLLAPHIDRFGPEHEDAVTALTPGSLADPWSLLRCDQHLTNLLNVDVDVLLGSSARHTLQSQAEALGHVRRVSLRARRSGAEALRRMGVRL